MDIKINSGTRQISSMHSGHFAPAEGKTTAKAPAPNQDTVTISGEGQSRLEALADKVATQLSAVTKEEFMDKLHQWQNENQNKLEIDPYRKVDPDGSIARKTYFESYLGQLKETEDTIKSYYGETYEEAKSAPIDSLTFVSAKYLCPWSDYFDSGIPEKERQWTSFQLRAMLTGTNVALNDPYALASVGGPKNVNEMDAIAKQAVKDKLDALLKEQEVQ